MGSIFGRYFQIATFGESHGPALGVVIDGVPAGLAIDIARVQKDLDRRKPGTSSFVSARKETDVAEILSGIRDGKTLGSPIAIMVRNQDAKSKDYQSISSLFRPGHADYTYFKKYGIEPQPGGGRSSGRETLARVAAGAVAKSLLEPLGICINGYTIQIGNIVAKPISIELAETNPLRCPDPEKVKEMEELVKSIRSQGDSIGGCVEIVAKGVPTGFGDPVFYKLDALLAWAMMSIGAVKGIEFGEGFKVAGLRGSECNDQMTDQGFESNRAGGILGGISDGMPIVMRLAIKPTPSISISQKTVDLDGKSQQIEIKGRHDPCICPRIVPVAEAMTAIVLADAWFEQLAHKNSKSINQ